MKYVFLLFSFSLILNGVLANNFNNKKSGEFGFSYPLSIMDPGAEATGGTISCANTTVQLMGSSLTPGVMFSWVGPNGFISNFQNPVVSVPGSYILTVTDPATSLSSSDTAEVILDTTEPGASATGGILDCSNPVINLIGSSSTAGVNYNWGGPNGFSSNFQNPAINVAGDYTLTVTNPSNGCTTSASATVAENFTEPDATATGGTLTCTTFFVQLAGSSSIQGVNYSWSGPGGFSSTEQNPIVEVPGSYTLTITDPVNGCSGSDTAEVLTNYNEPGATASGGNLNCTTPITLLSAISPTPGVNYSWIGPDGFTSMLQSPSVTQPGVYVLTVEDPANGCESTDSVTVNSDGTEPGAFATGGTLTSSQPTVQLQGNSPTPGVLFNWFGPGGFSSTEQNPVVDQPGLYILTVFDPISGCVSADIASVDLIQDVCVSVEVSLFLEGPYMSGLSGMSTYLNTHRGLLPGQTPTNPLISPTPAGNPYRGAPWNYEGTNAEETFAGPYINDAGLAVTDWVLVSFRASPAAEDQFLQANGLLYEDGHIEFIEPCLLSSSGPSEVWIVIEHRNHLGVMTDSALVVQDNKLVYDFRQTESYRSPASFGQKQLEPGLYTMFAADADQTDFPGFDINGSDGFIWQEQNGSFDNYMIGDFNLNGDVNGEDNFLYNSNNGIFSAVPKD